MEWKGKAMLGLGEGMEDRYEKAVRFFKDNKKYHRVLKAVEEKYKSRGTIGGVIELDNISGEERMLLCKIDSKFIHSSKARFSVAKFLKTFQGTELENLDFVKILNGYFGKELKTNRQIKEEKDTNRNTYFSEILMMFINTNAYNWLNQALESKSFGYMLILKEYEIDKQGLQNTLIQVMKAINSLKQGSGKFLRIAVFASTITKNPHFFDKDTLGGKLLINALAFLSGSSMPQNTEEENEILYSWGIIKDEISNYTSVSFIDAYTDDGIYMPTEELNKLNEPAILSLWNLYSITRIECKNNKIYVFENPSVFSEVLSRTVEYKPSLMCTNGQLRLASIILLDKLSNSVGKIYYSGDFDPEGIKIAYRLKQRYGNKLIFWRYDIDSYNAAKSTEMFNEKRWKQIAGISKTSLTDLIEEMGKSRRCGYQELLIDEYVKDIIEW